MRTLFICRKGDASASDYPKHKDTGLFNSASFVSNALNDMGIESKVVRVIDNNEIDKEVYHYKPSVVFIEAIWVTPSKFEVLMKLHKHVTWVVRVHSKIPFLALEGVAMNWLNEYFKLSKKHKKFFVSFNAENTTNDMNEIFNSNCVCLPCLYFPQDYNKTKDIFKNHTEHKSHIDVGCFGAIRPFKNQLMQAVAAIIFGKRINKPIKFHINETRVEQNGNNVLKNLYNLFKDTPNTELVCHKWMEHHKFVKIVEKMDIGMQLSYSESFNIVTADFVWNNIPILVSPDITWMTDLYKCDPNNTEEIVEKMIKIYKCTMTDESIIETIKHTFKNEEYKIHWINKIRLLEYNKKASQMWIDFLKKHHK